MTVQAVFTYLLALQFLVVAVHDLVDIPGWTHTAQVQAVIGRRKLWLVTLVNSIFPGLAVALAVNFWRRSTPWFVTDYWLVYCAVPVASAIAMWYIPYIFGATEKQNATTQQCMRARGSFFRLGATILVPTCCMCASTFCLRKIFCW